MSSPKGILGVEWGEEAAAVASRLGVVCGSGWKPWEGHADFEACQDLEHAVTLFGRPAYVRLFRQGAVLEGLALRFEHCDAGRQELAQKTREMFHLDEKESVYRVWADGAAVHLAADRSDDTCTLTVAGPRLGKAFGEYLLSKGLRALGQELGPH